MNAERFRERSEELARVLGETLKALGDREATHKIVDAFRALDERWRERDGIGFNITATEGA